MPVLHNPIQPGFFPDPSIILVGDTYYMANSTFVYFPCITISKSKDLQNWEIVGHAITDPSYIDMSRYLPEYGRREHSSDKKHTCSDDL